MSPLLINRGLILYNLLPLRDIDYCLLSLKVWSYDLNNAYKPLGAFSSIAMALAPTIRKSDPLSGNGEYFNVVGYQVSRSGADQLYFAVEWIREYFGYYSSAFFAVHIHRF